MDLSFLLLVIIGRLDGERSIYAGLHLFRGKRSGQTLQDVEYYNLKEFFCILPKLSVELYDQSILKLREAEYISVDANSVVHLTEAGQLILGTLPSYRFNGWDYRGREQIFFSRLSLVVQTLSNFKTGEKSFLPLQKDYDIQLFVKKMLSGQPISNPNYSVLFREELYQAINKSGMSEVQKVILTHRLSGYECTGWTWDQLSEKMNVNRVTLQLYFIESLHILLESLEETRNSGLLQKMTADIKVSSYLTDSSQKTKMYFEQGMSMEDIAKTRRLQLSTIEDHFVEMSINDPDFPVERFVIKEDIEAVLEKTKELGTKRLRLLKDEFSELTYFQLRIILGTQSRGEKKWTSKQY